jgi:hypothetical protein
VQGAIVTKLTRTEQIIAEKTVCVLLIRGESPEGKPIFAYLAIRADKLQAFMEAQQSGTFYPEEYGMVIESGEGEPSDEIKQKMTKEYGFNHDAMLDIQTPDNAHHLASNITAYAIAADDPEEKS